MYWELFPSKREKHFTKNITHYVVLFTSWLGYKLLALQLPRDGGIYGGRTVNYRHRMALASPRKMAAFPSFAPKYLMVISGRYLTTYYSPIHKNSEKGIPIYLIFIYLFFIQSVIV